MNTSTPRRIIIHAPNIHTGGGATLLTSLLDAGIEIPILLSVDERYKVADTLGEHINVERFAGTISQRFAAERWLKKNARSDDLVLCFGNLPPLFNLESKVAVLLHNKHLIDETFVRHLSAWARLRTYIERFWLKLRVRACDVLVVQTGSMARAAVKWNPEVADRITVLPFVAGGNFSPSKTVSGGERDDAQGANQRFIYVAAGEPYKQHRELIEAWSLLAREGVRPELITTIKESQHERLVAEFSTAARNSELKFANHSDCTHAEILDLLTNADALIYPSLTESFGLPLLEARSAGLDIIAGELDYVRDIVEPAETFDATSPLSIARAVKRYLGIGSERPSLLSSDQFLSQLVRHLYPGGQL